MQITSCSRKPRSQDPLSSISCGYKDISDARQQHTWNFELFFMITITKFIKCQSTATEPRIWICTCMWWISMGVKQVAKLTNSLTRISGVDSPMTSPWYPSFLFTCSKIFVRTACITSFHGKLQPFNKISFIFEH